MLLNPLFSLFHLLGQTGAAEVALPWWKSGFGLLGLLALAVVLTWFIASSFTKSIRMPEQLSRIWLILLVLAIAALMIATKWPPKFGVDLRGGISYIGQLNMDAFEGEQTTNLSNFTAADIIGTLSQRINPGGVSEIVIRALGADKIELIIPEVDEAAADEIWQRLVRTGHLQFRIVATRGGIHNKEIAAAEAMAAKGETSRNITMTNSEGQQYVAARWYSLARENITEEITPDTIVPIKDVPVPSALVRDRQTGQLINMNEVPFVTKDSGRDFAVWLKEKGIRSPQVLMLEPREDMNVEGKDLYNIMQSIDQYGRPSVAFSIRGPAVSKMRKLTTRYRPTEDGNKYHLGIVIDDQVHSAPTINSEISGSGVIEGRFTEKEIEDLIITLQSGKIDVALNPVPISKQFVQSTLGEELKQKGIYALIVSYVAIFVFVMVYYQWFAGTVANLALFLNLVLTLAVVMAINQPLTLTGLAGMILTIGMAVDSNVLIYERIREELEKGASLRAAFRTGFERATITIVDSNLTTVLAALVLYVIGTEQLKGFAITLILGVVSSMFTAIFCSWTIFNIAEKRGWITKLRMMQVFPSGKVFDFLGKKGICFALSAAVIGLGLVGMYTLGNKLLDIDLRGGSTAQVVFNQPTNIEEIRKTLDSQDFKFRDEKVTFSATELSDSLFPQRSFKIDSNVPSPDVAKGDSWKRLDEILQEVFKGKLELHEVKFDPTAITTEKIGDASAPPATSGEAAPATGSVGGSSNKVGLSRFRWLPYVLGTTLQFPSTLALVATQEPAAPSISAPPATPPQQPATSDASAAQAPVTPPSAPIVGGQAGIDSAAPATVAATPQRYRSKVNLTFKDKITGKSIRTMLVEGSAKLDRPVEEDQIRLSSPDLPTEGSALATPLKNWTVEFETNQPDDAKFILEKWQEGFNQQAMFPTNSDVGGQVAKDAQWQAFAAILASCIGIILYVWIRFQNVAFGVAGVVALIHDVLVTLAVIALTHYVADYLGFALVDKFKINLSMIAALLTIIGYSINDTIVIFDRLREIRGKRLELSSQMVNEAVSQTLSRTFLTAGTTFAVVFILYLIGGETVHGFAFAMCVGVLVGTYSSVFIAAPIAVWMINKLGFDPNRVEDEAAKA